MTKTSKQKYHNRQKNGCSPPASWRPCVICGDSIPVWQYGNSPTTCNRDESGKDCTLRLRRQNPKLFRPRNGVVKKNHVEKKEMVAKKEGLPSVSKTDPGPKRSVTCFRHGRSCKKYDDCLGPLGKWTPQCVGGQGWEDRKIILEL